jgi:glucose 1-dehydrogenase
MKAVAVFSGTKEVSYMTFVPADLRDVAVLVEPLTIGEKAFAQVALIQSRLPWLDPDAPSEAPGRGLIAMVLGIGPVGLLGAMMLVAAGVETYMYSRGQPPDPRITAVESIEETYLSAKTTSAEQRAALVNNIDLVYEAVGASALAFQVRLARAA